MMMTDLTFVPLLEKLAGQLPTIQRYVILTDGAHMPKTTLKNAVPYEEWIAEADGDFEWKSFDENTAAGMCYTSGTTGTPRACSIRTAPTCCTPSWRRCRIAKGIAARDVVLPVVPLFHANCWSLAFSTPLTGCIAHSAGDLNSTVRRSTNCSTPTR
jgi:fatty-acyl-CoA synthase